MATRKKFKGNMLNNEPVPRLLSTYSDQEYIDERLQSQIDWHRDKSQQFDKKGKTLRSLDMVIAALVPLTLAIGSIFDIESPELNDMLVLNITKVVSALAGVYLTISAGFFELEGFEKNAKSYKGIYTKLESEKFKYMSRTEPYDEEDAFPMLVMNVENELHQDLINYFKTNKDLSSPNKNREEEK